MRYILILLGLLLATGVHAASVTLAWDASPDASVTGYKLHWGTSSNNYTMSTNVGAVLTTTVSTLTNGVTYYFVATAYNVDVESDYSNMVSYRPPFPKPTPPGQLRKVVALLRETWRSTFAAVVPAWKAAPPDRYTSGAPGQRRVWLLEVPA